MKRILYTVIAALCIDSVAIADQQAEKILGYTATQTGVIFQVSSGGCTHPEDFVMQVNLGQVAEVTLLRIRPDTCYSYIPTGIKMKIPYSKIGIEPGQAFIVKNQNGVVRGWLWKDQDLLSQ